MMFMFINSLYADDTNPPLTSILPAVPAPIINLPNTYSSEDKAYSLKYPENWSYTQQSPRYVTFHGVQGTASVSLQTANFEDLPKLLDFMKFNSQNRNDLTDSFFLQGMFNNLRILQAGPFNYKSSDHVNLPGYFFTALYDGEHGPGTLWTIMVARPQQPNYIIFAFYASREDYKTYLATAKEMYLSLQVTSGYPIKVMNPGFRKQLNGDYQ